MGYGIPVNVLPVSDTGIIKRTNQNKWIAKYAQREQTLIRTGIFDGIDIPRGCDVLTGTGRPTQQHPGNVYMRNLVESCMEEFIGSTSERKAAIDKVYFFVKVTTGRFLYQGNDGWWRESTEKEAKEKVCTTFLTARTKQNNETRRASASDSRGFVSSETLLFLPHGKRARYDSSSCFKACA